LTRWTHLVALLSLDRVTPLIRLMGLRLDGEGLRVTLRALIEEVRTEYATTLRLRTDLGARALDAIALALGPDAAAHMRWWFRVRARTMPSDAPAWSRWELVFRHDQHPRRGPILSWPSPLSEQIARSYAFAVDLGDFHNLRDGLDSAMTDWDLRTYARHRWVPGGSGADPMVHVEQVIRMVRFQSFCAELAPRLSAELDKRARSRAIGYLQKLEVTSTPGFTTLGEMVARDRVADGGHSP
jgi:hypothetical protein